MEIEHALRQGMSLGKIATKLGKHHSTPAREVLARRIASDTGAFGRLRLLEPYGPRMSGADIIGRLNSMFAKSPRMKSFSSPD